MNIIDCKDAKTARRNAFRFATAGLITSSMLLLGAGTASAAAVTVPLGTAGTYAVLAGTGVTATGTSVLNGDLGTSPTPAVADLANITVNGATHLADTQANTAKTDLTTAYNYAAGELPVSNTFADVTGKKLTAGIYASGSGMLLTGASPLTLDGGGDPNAVFVFQVGSALTVESGATVALTGGAQACNVFWQVGSTATLGTDAAFIGTIMASTSITLATGADLEGRALASTGSVTLDSNTINVPTTCVVAPVGGVQTGDGSTSAASSSSHGLAYGLTALGVIALAAAVVGRNRRNRFDSV